MNDAERERTWKNLAEIAYRRLLEYQEKHPEPPVSDFEQGRPSSSSFIDLSDLIDIHIEVEGVKFEKLGNDIPSESSCDIRKRVNYARNIQLKRYKEYNIFSNSELTPKLINRYCKLKSKETKVLESAFDRLGLSARAYSRILKVARTIADLDSSENIEISHLSEAIQYRSLDRKYWNR